jgi:hypothetical protein
MKNYLLTIQQPDGPPPESVVMDAIMRDVTALDREMREAGVWVFNGGLHPPSTTTVVRSRGGDIEMTDGPYAEGKEHIGGLAIIRVEDLDAALEWGRKLARATTLPVEVRPFADEAEH